MVGGRNSCARRVSPRIVRTVAARDSSRTKADWIGAALEALDDGGIEARARRAARGAIGRHQGQLLLALRRPRRAPDGVARRVGATRDARRDRPGRRCGRRPGRAVEDAVEDRPRQRPHGGGARDPRLGSPCAEGRHGREARRRAPPRVPPRSVPRDRPARDDVEARALLGYSLLVGDHFIKGKTTKAARARALERALDLLASR